MALRQSSQAAEDAVLHGAPYPPLARGESRLPPVLTVGVAILLQVLLPPRLAIAPQWVLPVLEGVLLIGLLLLSPQRQVRADHLPSQGISLVITAIVTIANVASLALLAHYLLLRHHPVVMGRELVLSGALIWATNVLIFGLWYWEADRGGPGVRAAGADRRPDFLFPQMADNRWQPSWRPVFMDYLYVSLTNATAFGPTDTMPLTVTAKILMGLESLVSLVTIGLVVARAVSILD